MKLARFLAPAALALLLPAAGLAQDTVLFDPSFHLEGFDQASVSDYESLYPLRQYLDKTGSEVSAEELEKLRERWRVERAAVADRIQAILGDPREAQLYRLEKDLARHEYFKNVRFAVDRSVAGCLFLVQQPSVSPPVTQDTRRIADFYGPPMRRLLEAFDKGFAKPLGLERRADYPVSTLCVLENEDEYHAFGQVTEQMWRLGPAYYEPGLQLIVAYGDPFAPETTPARQRRAVLAAHARALQHAHYSGRGDRPHSLWLNLGFASWISWREGVLAEANDKTAIDADQLGLVVQATQSKEDRGLFLHPLLDLLQARTTADILLLAKNRALDLNEKEPEPGTALQLFYAQSALWMHFLHDSQGGRYREPFLRFFKSAMDGLAGLDAFYLAFRGIEVADLDREFYAHLAAEHARAFPKVVLDRAWIDAPFGDRKREARTAGPAPAARSAAEPSAATIGAQPFAPALVGVGPKDVDGQHGLAMLRAMRGDLEGALGALEELAAASPAPPEDVRIAREIERVRQFILLRDGYLQSLIRSRQPLVGKHRNLEFAAPVEKVEEGWIHLGENRLGLSKIPLSELEPFDVARQAGRRDEQGAAEPWARFWPYIWVGEKKWEPLLKDDSERAKELREDAHGSYPQIQRTAQAAVALNGIAALPEPRSLVEADKLFGTVRSLLAEHGDLPLVQRKTDALRRLVGGVIVTTYAEEDPSKLCHGTWTTLGNGLVNIVYEFAKPEEARDFVRVPGYLDELRKTQGSTVLKEEDSSWTVAGGEFAGSGSACYRHFADLTVPITLRYEVLFRPAAVKEAQPPAFVFLVGACDDGKGSYVSCLNFGSLSVIDVPNRIYTTLADDKTAYAKKVYRLELENDGTLVTTRADGQKKFEAQNAGRRSGSVILWFHSDHAIALQRLEIEGRLDPAWPEKARSQFYRNKLAEIGFK